MTLIIIVKVDVKKVQKRSKEDSFFKTSRKRGVTDDSHAPLHIVPFPTQDVALR